MKKIACLFLVLVIIFSLAAVAYAVPTVGDTVYDEDIIDEVVPQGDAKDKIEVIDEKTDKDSGVADLDNTTIVDEETPGGDAKLPETSGIPAELFYVVGGVLIASALLIAVKKSKASAKG